MISLAFCDKLRTLLCLTWIFAFSQCFRIWKHETLLVHLVSVSVKAFFLCLVPISLYMRHLWTWAWERSFTYVFSTYFAIIILNLINNPAFFCIKILLKQLFFTVFLESYWHYVHFCAFILYILYLLDKYCNA